MTRLEADTVDVVVPTRNNLDQLRRCLVTLEQQTVRPTQVLVCVDGSTDGTLEYLETLSIDRVVVLSHPRNRHEGRARTRNLALPRIRSPFVLLADSDMEFDPTAIEEHLHLAVVAQAISVGSVVYDNARSNPWAEYLMKRGRNRVPPGDRLPYTQFTTSNALVPADKLLSLGGFDERMVKYGGEDLELAFRLQKDADQVILNNPAAIAHTTEPKTWRSAMDQFREYGATNLRILHDLHPDAPLGFELGRRRSRRPVDRLFVGLLNPGIGALVRAAIPFAPSRLQAALFNYEVVRSVHAGYVSGPEGL